MIHALIYRLIQRRRRPAALRLLPAAAALAVAVGAMLGSCTRSSEVPVPRPQAWPRIALYDTAMVYVNGAIGLTANAGARFSSPRPGWYDIDYPRYNATMHITVTDVTDSTIGEVRRNRLQRLMLNAGDRPGTSTEFVNDAGWDVLMMTTRGSVTPVQFVATDGLTTVVSGVAYMHDPRTATAYDSVAPVVQAIADDALRTLRTLGHELP